MHDYIISTYTVDLKNKTIELCAEDTSKKQISRFIAKDVLTHLFQGILEYNIILDIQESTPDSFIKENILILKEKKQECWPIDYQTIDELRDFLYKNKYKYIEIQCSYGLQGWILAKEFQID